MADLLYSVLAFVPWAVSAWWSVKVIYGGSAVLLPLAGIFVAPLGWLHGVFLIFGGGGWLAIPIL